MTILILMASALICAIFLLGMDNKMKTKEYIKWGLGVDCCCYYSPPFTVNNQQVIIWGFQEVLGDNSAILYSVVKMNWLGKRRVYGHGLINGNFQSPKHFQLTLNDIPNGTDYKIEVFNSFKMSYGQFKLIEG